MKTAIVLTSLFCIAVAGLVVAPAISQWERTHGYPFGQMCDSVFTGFVNTCPQH